MENTTTLSLTLPAPLVWGALTLGAVVLASWLVYLTLPQSENRLGVFERFRTSLGMERLHTVPFLTGVTLWVGLILALIIGLFGLLYEVLSATASSSDTDYLFYVLRIAGLTGVLGAVIALPFTMTKLELNRRDTDAGGEKLELERLGLFESRLDRALTKLSARYDMKNLGRTIFTEQNTAKKSYFQWLGSTLSVAASDVDTLSEWRTEQITQPDIELRFAGMSQLEGIAHEYRSEARRIITLINGYVRQNAPRTGANQSPARYYDEISQGASEQQVYDVYGVWPNIADNDNVQEWLASLSMRDDINLAMQITARLNKFKEVFSASADVRAMMNDLPPLQNDFSNLNLQSVRLEKGHFQNSDFSYSSIEAANISNLELRHCNFDHSFLDGSAAIFVESIGCTYDGTKWILADWQRCEFRHGKIKGATFHDCHLVKISFHHMSLNYTSFRQSDMTEIAFTGCSMMSTSFERCLLYQCSFVDCPTLEFADFKKTGLFAIDLSKSSVTQDQINASFGDESVILPEGIIRPSNWPNWTLGPNLSRTEYYKWRNLKEPSKYSPPSPLTTAE